MLDPTNNPCDWLASYNWFRLVELLYPKVPDSEDAALTPWDRLMKRATEGTDPEPHLNVRNAIALIVAFFGMFGSIALAIIAYRYSGPGLLHHLLSTGLTLFCSLTLTCIATGAIADHHTQTQ